MTQSSERVDVVVLNTTSIVRALVSAGLSPPHAQAAARMFMPHLQVQEQADLCAFKGARMPRSKKKRIASKRASAILSMLDKELDRLCDQAQTEERTLHARRGSGIALLHMLKAEHRANKSGTISSNRLSLTPAMRVTETEP
jgi:hypothetical protein